MVLLAAEIWDRSTNRRFEDTRRNVFVQTIEDASDRTHDFGMVEEKYREPMDPTLSVWILREAKALEFMERMILCLSVHELQRAVFA